ncbi:MAG: gamma carbonic anhydrase family protein [Planctomycetota bacterium]
MQHNTQFLRSADWYLAGNAVIEGDVTIETDVNIWYGAVLRGDDAAIHVGAGTNIQDLTMVHADPGKPMTIGPNCTIGHRAILHGRVIAAGCLIGMGAILMEDVEIGAGSLIGAGAVVSPGTRIPSNSLVRGVPGKVVRETTEQERAGIVKSAAKYVENAREFYERYG